ncbi:MAG TPA: hypothetical protein VGU66_17370 [Candidatus Elarobacter sp.]|nr:hypothetical protein [Candidatus Elarobacter sp.]
MTVHDRLVALGADEREALEAETLLCRGLPLGGAVVVTEAVVAAARDGDANLVASLFGTMARELDDERIRVEAEKNVLPSLWFSATYLPASTAGRTLSA